jgi:hypothetical protein
MSPEFPMNEKYLLYLDILNFSDLVKNDSSKVDYIYEIIDSLNVHKHDAFDTIVFSDTVLVYNKIDPLSQKDHSYLTMFSIEFAQDLLYRFIGKELYFRGVLTWGPFRHYQLKNINCFYGPALIESYLGEKEIQGTGLYIHNSAQQNNEIFKINRFDMNYSFVYLNQNLDRLFHTFGPFSNVNFPILDPFFLDDTDFPLFIAKDIVMLRDVYDKMTNHKDKKVRVKFSTTWQFYKLRYPEFLSALESNRFSFDVICPGYDWSDAEKRAYND